jgi:HAD superfamily hydrolase (TIGR01549 family)
MPSTPPLPHAPCSAGTDALLLDFGGTIEGDGVHWAPRFYAAYRAAGGGLPYPAFEPLFVASDRDLEDLADIRRRGFQATVEAEAQLLGARLESAASETVDTSRIAEHFHAEAVAAVARNRPVLERLAARYRLGVVSNFTGNLDVCLRELDLLGLFAVTVDSAVIGIRKPAPGIFLHALAALRAVPRCAWMVGDNLAFDLRPAGGLGLRTCWIAPADRLPPLDWAPTARIQRLVELGALFLNGG